MLYIKYSDAVKTIVEKLIKHGCSEETARTVANTAVGISRDGVYSHGINRVELLLKSFDSGVCNPKAIPQKEVGFGGFERWNGNCGIGIINALTCTDRVIELAREHGVGCVALRNTNHWFRAGAYGWRIADAGMTGILWTNSKTYMVFHGTTDRLLGSTPVVFAVPRREGNVVADVSLGVYSYGKMQLAQLAGKQMDKFAGYNKDGVLSKDPAEVMSEGRLLPMAEHKGSVINLLLDLIGSTASLGYTSCDVREFTAGTENSISQCFIAINSRAVNDPEAEEEITNRLIEHLLNAHPAEGFGAPRYPGQNVMAHRRENDEKGIPVDERVWNGILAM